MDSTPWIALISTGGALIGALGSQGLSGWLSLRRERFRLLQERRVEAYSDLVVVWGDFAINPGKDYWRFLAALQRAAIVGSDEVASALAGRGGLQTEAQRLRAATTFDEQEEIRAGGWRVQAERVLNLMRQDLA
jgi:hypothetical protein